MRIDLEDRSADDFDRAFVELRCATRNRLRALCIDSLAANLLDPASEHRKIDAERVCRVTGMLAGDNPLSGMQAQLLEDAMANQAPASRANAVLAIGTPSHRGKLHDPSPDCLSTRNRPAGRSTGTAHVPGGLSGQAGPESVRQQPDGWRR